MALVISVTTARRYLPATPAEVADATIEAWIHSADAAAAGRCGYPARSSSQPATLSEVEYTLDHDGPGGRDLELRVLPATAVTEVIEDVDLEFDGDPVSSSDYTLLRERTLRLTSTATHGVWTRQPGAIRVTFSAGYAIPAPTGSPLEQLVGHLVAHLSGLVPRQGRAAVQARESSTTYRPEEFPPIVEHLLGHFLLPSALI